MSISSKKLWITAKYVYKTKYSDIGNYIPSVENSEIIDSTAKSQVHADFESHGLQASLIQIDGQYVVATRGTSDKTDFKQDADLNDPEAYQKASQFKDLACFLTEMQKEHPDFKPNEATYTGHSLGAALASFAAVHYRAEATVFSAPSAYNMLTPEERSLVKAGRFNQSIHNIKHVDDIVPDVPKGVPTIGKQSYTPDLKSSKSTGSFWMSVVYRLTNVSGHMTDSFNDDANFDQSGQAILLADGVGQSLHQQFNRNTAGGLLNQLATVAAIGAQTVNFTEHTLDSGQIAIEKGAIEVGIATLEEAKAPLRAIKKINQTIYSDMKVDFQRIAEQATQLPYITAKDVEDVIQRYRLKPKYNVDLKAVERVHQLVDTQIVVINGLEKALKMTASHVEQQDSQWAKKFKDLENV